MDPQSSSSLPSVTQGREDRESLAAVSLRELAPVSPCSHIALPLEGSTGSVCSPGDWCPAALDTKPPTQRAGAAWAWPVPGQRLSPAPWPSAVFTPILPLVSLQRSPARGLAPLPLGTALRPPLVSYGPGAAWAWLDPNEGPDPTSAPPGSSLGSRICVPRALPHLWVHCHLRCVRDPAPPGGRRRRGWNSHPAPCQG